MNNKLVKFIILLVSGLVFAQILTRLVAGDVSPMHIVYPSDGTIFPPDFSPPTFIWKNDGSKPDYWAVEAKTESKIVLTTKVLKEQWKPSKDEWNKIKQSSFENRLTVTIAGIDYKTNKQLYSSSINIKTSRDSVVAPIFYRDVPLPFSYTLRHLDSVRWRLGYVGKDTIAKIVMEKLPVCANCHTFSFDGKTIGMDVDAHSAKDAYGIAHIEPNTVLHTMIHWSVFQNGEPTYGLLSSASPDGNYFLSTLKDNEFFVVQPDTSYSQLFFPIKGVISVYNRNTDKFTALPGCDDTSLVSTNATWSPDGKDIYFCRSKAIPNKESGFVDSFNRDSIQYSKLIDEFYSGKRKYKYDIYKVPFNDGRGGNPEPVAGASANGMSNYFPRISPNGKWLVYDQAKNYMLLQPDSKLWIIPAGGGVARELKCNAEGLMNSWHSWSPNSHWLVFSSKRQGTYTKLYLTHIDDEGNDSPAILLENLCLPGRASNIPEFVNVNPGDFLNIDPKFLTDDYFSFQSGIRKFDKGDLNGALDDFNKAVLLDSSNYMVYGARGYTLAELGRHSEALLDYNKAEKLKSTDAKLYNIRAFTKIELKDFDGAAQDFEKAVAINPYDAESYNGLGCALTYAGNYRKSLPAFDKAIKLNPKFHEAFYQRGLALFNLDSMQASIEDFSKSIALQPKFHYAYLFRGLSYKKIGNMDAACEDFRKALRLGSKSAEQVINDFCR